MVASPLRDNTFVSVVQFLALLVCLLLVGVVGAVESEKPVAPSARGPNDEKAESRTVVDRQIGTVKMPYDGYLSAAVYDSKGQLVRTLLAQASEKKGTVTLNWDGKDDLGRPVIDSGTYTWKALSSQVKVVDQGAVGDSAFDANDPKQDMGYTVQNLAVNQIGGTSGEVGGTFAQNDGDSYYGDTKLSQNLTLETPITASGTLFITDVSTMKGKAFVGHFSASTDDNRREFIGLELEQGAATERTTVGIRARIYRFNGNFASDALSNPVDLPINNGDYNWTYSYDPTYEAGNNDESSGTHKGPEGRLTLRIFNNAGVDYTLYAINAGTHRDAGSTFDAFGMGIVPGETPLSDSAANTTKIFIDDVRYGGHDGTANFNAEPNWSGVGNATDGNSYGWSSAKNIDDSLYVASLMEEGAESKKLNQRGRVVWHNFTGAELGIAADEKYVYTTRHVFVDPAADQRDPRTAQEDRLYRYFSRDGGPAPFAPGVHYIVINKPENASDPRPTFTEEETKRFRYTVREFAYTPFEFRTVQPAWGITVDRVRLWVSDYRTNSVKIYNKADGAYLGEINSKSSASSFFAPMGIAVDFAAPNDATHATVWVAYRTGSAPSQDDYKGNIVAKFTFDGDYSKFTKGTAITTHTDDPTGLAIGGPNGHLFFAETGKGQIHEYTTEGKPVSGTFASFGSKHTGGPLADNQFYWNYYTDTASLAIDSTGMLSVNDDHRIQRFLTVDRGKYKAGDLFQSIFSEFAPAPHQTFNYTAGGKHYLLSNRYVFEVEPEYTGGPRRGWMGDGAWRLVERFYTPHGEENGSIGKLVTLYDNGTPRKFIYMGTSCGIAIHSIDSAQRLCTILGRYWTGVSRFEYPKYNPVNGIVLGGQFNWSDTDGDGVMDWNGVGSGNADGEVSWFKANGQLNNLYSQSTFWTDSDGNIWYVDGQYNIVKLPLRGFDARHNPLYNWADVVVVVPYDPSGMGFVPTHVRVAGNGEIVALGDGRAFVGNHNAYGIHCGGSWFARYSKAGKMLLLAPSAESTFVGLALDDTDPTPDYIYLGETQYGYVFSNDGLLVSKFTAGASHGGPTGWMDHAYSVDVFTHPETGKTYFYGEEVYYSKSNRWRIDNLDTVRRFQKDFSYTYNAGIAGQWGFENNLDDSVGGQSGTFSGGTPSYTAGKVGSSALHLDGVDDGLDIAYPTDFNGYTVAAWVKADTAGVNQVIIDRRSSYAGTLGEIRIGATGKFEHLATVGRELKTITGTTVVQAGTWYHVAVTAKSDGTMHLYVNGLEEGKPIKLIGNLWVEGDRFHIGGGPPVGAAFAGLVDDLRIYQHPLTQAEIQAISGATAGVK